MDPAISIQFNSTNVFCPSLEIISLVIDRLLYEYCGFNEWHFETYKY